MLGIILISGMVTIILATVGACVILEEVFVHCPKKIKKFNDFVEKKIFKM